jgi:pimeloyl-ACP methyl ester carboxylesterase
LPVPSRHLLAVLLLVLTAAGVRADIVHVAGRRIKCAVVSEDENEVVVNTYNSRFPRAVLGTERFPRSKVKKIVRETVPLHEYRLRAAKAETVVDLLELAAFCDEHKLKAERERIALRAAALDPENEHVRRLISPSKAQRLIKADPTLNPDLTKALAAYLEIEDAGERKTARADLKRSFGYAPGDVYLERAWRSARSPRGLREDRPLTLRSKEIKAVYTLRVPKDYDPFRAYPLVVGLHGGGPGGKERDMVVGSGRAAMMKYGRQSAKHGWIVVCPTAIAAPWAATPNHDYVLALIEEISLLYNVDRNRIYLIGHSMGGYGSFHFGPKYAEMFAAVAPMSGGGAGGSMKRFKDTATPVYIYHSADDAVCGVQGSRTPANALQSMDADFVYTEVNGHGHGIAPGVLTDIFDYFAVRTLARGKGRRFSPTHGPDSSFTAKVTREEKAYLGNPLEASSSGASADRTRKKLLAELRLGGGSAQEAAEELIALDDRKTLKPLGEIAGQSRWAEDVRAAACRVLGRIGDDDSVRSLSSALRAESWRVRDAAAEALGVLGSAKGVAPLLKSVEHEWTVFESKRIRGNNFHYSDWEVCHRSFAVRATALGRLGDASAVRTLHRIVVTRVFGGDWIANASARAGQNARRPVRACALAVVAALETLGGEGAVPALEELKGHLEDDGEVVRRCDTALRALGR